MTDQPNVEVITTVVINGASKTFTATADTTGDPRRAASSLILSVGQDAAEWGRSLEVAQ